MTCKHSYIDKTNDGIYGQEVCRFCGETKRRKETITLIKRHLKGLEKAIEKLETQE